MKYISVCGVSPSRTWCLFLSNVNKNRQLRKMVFGVWIGSISRKFDPKTTSMTSHKFSIKKTSIRLYEMRIYFECHIFFLHRTVCINMRQTISWNWSKFQIGRIILSDKMICLLFFLAETQCKPAKLNVGSNTSTGMWMQSNFFFQNKPILVKWFTVFSYLFT